MPSTVVALALALSSAPAKSVGGGVFAVVVDDMVIVTTSELTAKIFLRSSNMMEEC